MNRYTANGLVADALLGKRVLIVSPHGRAVRDALEGLKRLGVEDAIFEHAGSVASMTLPSGGQVILTTPRDLRGRSADVVLIEDELGLDRQQLDSAYAVIAGSPCGEIIA